ncbi:serine hydrolase FSH [Stachybotrys elegans]|uniref:Serine hydrolase FSH n=1 Tax=Stachybotrys elegans TaxID=80388 RepID=A0A8K0WII2_9HYPO|nr:serine hydrolase FSH [Stachybotrys elegans]
MKQQMAGLRYELDGDHEYDFVEGVLDGPMADDVASLAKDQSFYYYWHPDTFEHMAQSLKQLDTYLQTDGPFDVLVAFSAGALLVALHLLNKSKRGEPLPFRCAIFICTAGRLVEAAKAAGLDLGQDKEQPMRLLELPTVHIRGASDRAEPTGSQELAQLCDPMSSQTVVHPGAHEFPKAEHLTQAVHAIRKAVAP